MEAEMSSLLPFHLHSLPLSFVAAKCKAVPLFAHSSCPEHSHKGQRASREPSEQNT
jgi:hypothetical protein